MAAVWKRVCPFRLVAVHTAHGGSDDDVFGRERSAKETSLVDCTVRRQLFISQHAVVDTHGLDRAEEPALVALVERTVRATDAQRVRADVAFVCADLHGIGDGRRLENVVLCPVSDSRNIATFPCVLGGVAGKVHVSAIHVLEGESTACSAVHVVEDVQLVVVAYTDEVGPEDIWIGRGLQRVERVCGRVADDLNCNHVGETRKCIYELREGASAEVVAIVHPCACVGVVVLEARDVALHEIDPLRR